MKFLRLLGSILATIYLTVVVSSCLNHKPRIPEFYEQWWDGKLTTDVKETVVVYRDAYGDRFTCTDVGC